MFIYSYWEYRYRGIIGCLMMDLISGYLLVIVVLLTINIALMFGNYRINSLKLLVLSILFSSLAFLDINLAIYFKDNLTFVMNYLNYFFIVLSIVQFIVLYYYSKKDGGCLKFLISIMLVIFFISVFILSSQSNLSSLLDCLLFSFIILVISFLSYQVSKLLVHAKRDYPIVVGEYMCLSSILIFIFGLTYYSTLNLDYSMFSSFLILTPTYQLIYILIAVVIILIMGLLYNDKKLKGGN